MGYIFVAVLGLLVVVLAIVFFTRGRSRPVGQVQPRSDITVKQPATETAEPTKSATASDKNVERASRHTPPA